MLKRLAFILFSVLPILLFSPGLLAQTPTAADSSATSTVTPSASTSSSPTNTVTPPVNPKTAEAEKQLQISQSFALNTLTLAAIQRIHIDGKERLEVDALASTATASISGLTTASGVAQMMLARTYSENVCRYVSQVITGKLRKIENGSTGLGLLSVFASGIGIATKVIGSARFAALVAGGAKAYEDTFEKSDTEHGTDTLRLARMAITTARLQIGDESSRILRIYNVLNSDPAKQQQLNQYQHNLSDLVNICRG